MEKLKKKELSKIEKQNSSTLNPLKTINEDIYSFAELKQKEIDELKKLEAFRREFIADVSHELKTPIFASQGFVHTLLDGAVNDKAVRSKFLKKAAKSLDGLDCHRHNLGVPAEAFREVVQCFLAGQSLWMNDGFLDFRFGVTHDCRSFPCP
jgi:two-component system phosphate regulon sensor histidine kinase PhoR